MGQGRINMKPHGGKPTGYANRIGRSDLDEELNKRIISDAMECAKDRKNEQKELYLQENATNQVIWKDGLNGGENSKSLVLTPRPTSLDHTPAKRMPSISTTYCSQPEVHHDIYKKMPINSIVSLNRSQLTGNGEEASRSSAPTMHLLPQRNESNSRSPKTVAIKDKLTLKLATPKSDFSKTIPPAISPVQRVDQTTQTHLTLPVTPLTLDETSIQELSKIPKVTVDKAPLGVPTQLPVQQTALNSPISPRQSSRKFSRSPKSPKPSRFNKSKPCSPLSGKFILEEEDVDCSMEGEAVQANEQDKVPKPKVVWTNKHYND